MAGTKYCTNVKNNIIKQYKEGVSGKDICQKFCMTKSSVNYIINKYKKQKLWELFREAVDQDAQPPRMTQVL